MQLFAKRTSAWYDNNMLDRTLGLLNIKLSVVWYFDRYKDVASVGLMINYSIIKWSRRDKTLVAIG